MDPSVQPAQGIKPTSKLPLLLIGLTIAAALIAFYLGRISNQATSSPTPPPSPIPPNLLFKSQNATFEGKITSISGKMLSVESENGQKGEFEMADNIIIYTFPKNLAIASPSSDLKLLETGKKVLITLVLMDGKYKAGAISYFRTLP